MSEPTWTTMTIGGVLPADKQRQLNAAIDDDFYEQIGDILERHWELTPAHYVIQGQVNYGNPQSLKNFCQKYGLHYLCHFGSHAAEWEAGLQVWHPGDEEEIERGATSNSYEPAMTLDELRSRRDDGKMLTQIIEELERFEDSVIPPLTLGPETPKLGDRQDDAALAEGRGR